MHQTLFKWWDCLPTINSRNLGQEMIKFVFKCILFFIVAGPQLFKCETDSNLPSWLFWRSHDSELGNREGNGAAEELHDGFYLDPFSHMNSSLAHELLSNPPAVQARWVGVYLYLVAEVRGLYVKGGEENAKGLDPYSHPTRFGRSRNFKKFANQHSNLQFSTLLHHTIFITQCYSYLMKSRIAEIYLFHILIHTRALFHRQKKS